ncbi:MAG: hypothetical protein ABMA15_02130 [Vicinamibacterales bacterium]
MTWWLRVNLFLVVLGTGSPVGAQSTGDASFRVFHRGEAIGVTITSLVRDEGEWHLRGTGELKGMFQIVVRQFDIRYDDAWRPRFMTMELASMALRIALGVLDDGAVVHVAFGQADGRTRTDIVRSGGTNWGGNRVSPDTIPLPDFVFAAYEALAARLSQASPGAELRAFVVPRFEAAISVDGVSDEAVQTSSGVIATKRWRATVRRPEGPAPFEIWVEDGRMVRLELRTAGISVVRQDVVWVKAP